MTQSNGRSLNCTVHDETEKRSVRPFASHPRWLKWAQNACERHRLNGQKDVRLFQSPKDSDLLELDLRRALEAGGEELNSMLGRVRACNGNVNGSNACVCGHRQNLEALIEQEGRLTT
jgi:hypothetical protein